MACRMFGTKTLPESMIINCYLDCCKQISVKFESKWNKFTQENGCENAVWAQRGEAQIVIDKDLSFHCWLVYQEIIQTYIVDNGITLILCNSELLTKTKSLRLIANEPLAKAYHTMMWRLYICWFLSTINHHHHYCDVTMTIVASQITCTPLFIQRFLLTEKKYQSPRYCPFVRGIDNQLQAQHKCTFDLMAPTHLYAAQQWLGLSLTSWALGDIRVIIWV